jgi:N6-L-threonylcarbamoyladenine synthase
MLILSIESSCDETACSVVRSVNNSKFELLSSIVSSQIVEHERYGGVVPELAGRHHLELCTNVVRLALEEANVELSQIDLFAATRGPGLSAALLVGMTAGKAYALACGKPFVGVHHHEAHILSVLLEHENVQFPFVSALVSGGHTFFVIVDAPGSYRVMGGTIDDAAGEAYDKVSRMLGLGYPGGPIVDDLASKGDPAKYKLPRAMKDSLFDVSFSGLKTATKYLIRDNPDALPQDVCASFQEAVIDTLTIRIKNILKLMQDENNPAKAISIGGGVAANSQLRNAVTTLSEQYNIRALIPERIMCTDNAAMIGVCASYHYELRGEDLLDAPIQSSWPLSTL